MGDLNRITIQKISSEIQDWFGSAAIDWRRQSEITLDH